MSPELQIESASMLTVLYCVTMIQAEIHQLFQGEHAKTQFMSNYEYTKCCGYLEYKLRVIEFNHFSLQTMYQCKFGVGTFTG